MISSPPQEAKHIRGETLTPESPKPVHYPSPSNIPILEKQMDPMFNEPALNIGTPASFQSYPPPTQTPSAQSTASYYAEQPASSSYQNVTAQAGLGAPQAEYSQSTAYSSGLSAQTQDTSNQSFPSQNQAPALSFSEANSTSVQDNRSAYPHDASSYAALHPQTQPSQATQYPSQANDTSAINFQALLDNLTPAANSGASDRYATPHMHPQPSQSQGQTPISSIPAAPNLPPRPPAQEKPATHPNYSPSDDIRSYHPHSQKPNNAPFRAPAQLQTSNIQGGRSSVTMDNFSTTRSNQSPSTPGYGHRQSVDGRSSMSDDEDARWPPEINKLYEEFLDDERRFVTEGQWDQFPYGSRLFIGNLPTEKVTKRDIFHRFYRHGRLAQISIKQAYGFVQFLDAASCANALRAEQGSTVRGRKMHLEISKPQRNTKKADSHNNDRNGARRRSRSPDYTRGGTGHQQRSVDRYTSSQNLLSPRDKDNRRFRDDYRPIRSPSPPRRGTRGRDRSRDRWDRRRSPSRSPRRYRSPSPKRGTDDDLPLPHRAPHEVPDVQVLVVTEGLPRDFIRWVEDTFKQQGLRSDVLPMSARLSEPAVVRRQILEGVLAIVRLDRESLGKCKVNLQVFDRRGGIDNVQFNEYAELDPTTAAMLVHKAKQEAAQPAAPPAPISYLENYNAPSVGAPSYAGGSNAAPQYPPTASNNAANLSNIFALDSNSLSQWLGAMSQNAASKPPQPSSAGISPDLARLLGSVSTPTQPPAYGIPAQPSVQPYAASYQNATAAPFMGAQPPMQHTAPPMTSAPPAQPPPVSQPDMNEIMAQLAKYQR